jgi:hypothetical protein
VSRPEVFDKVTALAEWLIRQGKDPASVEMITTIASSAGVSPKTIHRRVAAAVPPGGEVQPFVPARLRA